MPRMRAPTSTRTPRLESRTPADPDAIAGQTVLSGAQAETKRKQNLVLPRRQFHRPSSAQKGPPALEHRDRRCPWLDSLPCQRRENDWSLVHEASFNGWISLHGWQQRSRSHRGDGAKTGAGRFLSHAEIAGSCAPGRWAKPASIGFRPAVARCCKIGSRPNPDRAVERHMARESFHEGEDGRRYGVMIINFRSCSAERCRPRPSEAAFLRLQSRRSLGELDQRRGRSGSGQHRANRRPPIISRCATNGTAETCSELSISPLN